MALNDNSIFPNIVYHGIRSVNNILPHASRLRLSSAVRLGNSGLKISKIVLGCMTYGSKEWQKWLLEGDDAIEQLKFAYDSGINTFDTADVCLTLSPWSAPDDRNRSTPTERAKSYLANS